MSRQILITGTTLGKETGPFKLYHTAILSFYQIGNSSYTKAELLAGVLIDGIPDYVDTFFAVSDNIYCQNYGSVTITLPTPSPTKTPTPSRTPSVTPSRTPSISITPSISMTPGASPSITPSATPSISASLTPSVSISATPSLTSTPSLTPSLTSTPSLTPSVTRTPSITPSETPAESPSSQYNYYTRNNVAGYGDAYTACVNFGSDPINHYYWLSGLDSKLYYEQGGSVVPLYSNWMSLRSLSGGYQIVIQVDVDGNILENDLCNSIVPTPTPTPSVTSSETPTPSVTPSVTPSITPTRTPSTSPLMYYRYRVKFGNNPPSGGLCSESEVCILIDTPTPQAGSRFYSYPGTPCGFGCSDKNYVVFGYSGAVYTLDGYYIEGAYGAEPYCDPFEDICSPYPP